MLLTVHNNPKKSTLFGGVNGGVVIGGVDMGVLTDRTVRAAGKGRHTDGDGLMLEVEASGSKRWTLRFRMGAKRRDMGLGGYPEVSLADARRAAFEARLLIQTGRDPIEAREERKRAKACSPKQIPTFEHFANAVIEEMVGKTKNAKVAYQWRRHLGPAYCGPLLDRVVNEITVTDVAAVLRPVWNTKPEVARKLFPSIRKVFDLAKVTLRAEYDVSHFEHPAQWTDLKALGFDAPRKLSRGHWPSLPYKLAPVFIHELRKEYGIASVALEFLMLTVVRTDSCLSARWSDIDLKECVWHVPLVNLKDDKHRSERFRVPLSKRAGAILQFQKGLVGKNPLVFPGDHGGRLSDMSMVMTIRRMNKMKQRWVDPERENRAVVPHGMRATFRTWAEETTQFPEAVIEECLGHKVGTQVQRAYRRTDVLEQRRLLMEEWCKFIEPSS